MKDVRLEHIESECRCVPWGLRSVLPQVSVKEKLYNGTQHSQGDSYCSPNGTDCYRGHVKDTFGCEVSCTGLHADVKYKNDETNELVAEITELGKVYHYILE